MTCFVFVEVGREKHAYFVDCVCFILDLLKLFDVKVKCFEHACPAGLFLSRGELGYVVACEMLHTLWKDMV